MEKQHSLYNFQSEIKNIQYKFKSNDRIIFGVDNIKTFRKVENVLVKNGCIWRSGIRFLTDFPDTISSINVNYDLNEPLKLSYTEDNVTSYKFDIHLKEDNVDILLLNIFRLEPNYIPKDKIIRKI